jgi:hypothetical protein
MRNAVFRVNAIDYPRGVELLTSSEDDDLVELRHFKKEGVEAKSLDCINSSILAIEDYLH